jgi:hypothetical protein
MTPSRIRSPSRRSRRRLLAHFDRNIASFEARYGAPSADGALASLASVKPVTYGYAKRTWGLDFN